MAAICTAQLGVERNVLRYRRTDVTVRAAEGAPTVGLVRVLLAAARVGARVQLSSAAPIPARLLATIEAGESRLRVASVAIESDTAFSARVVEERPARIRLIGGDGTVVASETADAPSARPAAELARELFAALGGDPDVAIWSNPVTVSGRVELLPFLREQAVSLTAHRFGNPYPAMGELEF